MKQSEKRQERFTLSTFHCREWLAPEPQFQKRAMMGNASNAPIPHQKGHHKENG